MIKEELKKEAEEFRKNLKDQIIAGDDFERLEEFDVNVEEAYIAGAESREKRIAELEENAEMLERIERLEGYERIVKKLQNLGFDTYMSIEEFCKEKLRLEEENAELKRITEHQQSSNMGRFFEIKKAKGIIKELLAVANENGLKVCDMYGTREMLKKAEDFIKEE